MTQHQNIVHLPERPSPEKIVLDALLTVISVGPTLVKNAETMPEQQLRELETKLRRRYDQAVEALLPLLQDAPKEHHDPGHD